jgi:hypothetical protein
MPIALSGDREMRTGPASPTAHRHWVAPRRLQYAGHLLRRGERGKTESGNQSWLPNVRSFGPECSVWPYGGGHRTAVTWTQALGASVYQGS